MLTSSSSRRSSSPTPSSSSSSSTSSTSSLQSLHAQFGRDTALGRHVFNVYTKKIPYSPSVSISTTSSPTTPFQEAEERKRRERKEVEEKLRGYKVKVKQVRKVEEEGRWRLRGGKKSEGSIREEMKEEVEERPMRVAVKSGEERKRELQERMSGLSDMKKRVMEERKRREEEMKRVGNDKSDREEERILKEIDERQKFLDEMRGQGKGAQYEAVIASEIAGLMRDLALTER